VKYIKGVPLLGTTWQSVLGLKPSCRIQQEYYRELKDAGFGGVFLMRSPALFITDPAIIERVLIKDFTNFYNR
jgi:cytochrome P450 family 6